MFLTQISIPEISINFDFPHDLDSRDERRDTGASMPEAMLDETMSVEPKKKGRFTVIENGTNSALPRNPSLANITEAMKRSSEAGRPPLSGSSLSGSTAAAVLPRLQELMDQATQHQLAMQKLIVAMQVYIRPSSPLGICVDLV